MKKILLFLFLCFPVGTIVHTLASDEASKLESLNELIDTYAREQTSFYGLASYYNNVNYYLVDDDELSAINEEELLTLNQALHLAIVGRFNILLLKAPNLSFSLDNSGIHLNNPADLDESTIEILELSKNNFSAYSTVLEQVRYAHLWLPLAWLAKLVEASLETLQASFISSWAWTLVIFTVLLKIILLPVSIMTVRFQREVSQVQAKLAPKLAAIKARYDGEDAHNRLIAAHSELGVSPFFTLKPILGSFIQIPILIAVFNALGEMPQFAGQSFLWISDLAYPDAITTFNKALPGFGNNVNLLPFAMAIISIIATISFQNRHAPKIELKRQKRNLFLMSGMFFILFYPFPAVMVLYWTLANIIQAVQQQIVKI